MESVRLRISSVLSADEQERARRFRFERDRRWFEVGRGLLRIFLAEYLGGSPEAIAFDYGRNGKPVLKEGGISFNLTHSDDLALFAFASSGSIGIDVERIRPMPEALRLASRFFSESERRTIEALPEADRLLGFFTCWTRKEAYIKAIGAGLSLPLDGFDVTAVPGSEPKLLRIDGDPNGPDRWSFAEIPVDDGFLGVVAYDAPIASIRFRRIPER